MARRPSRTPRASHGAPLGDEELDAAKETLGWPTEPRFLRPRRGAGPHSRQPSTTARHAEAEWHARFEAYAAAYPELAAEFEARMAGELPEGWDADLPAFADTQQAAGHAPRLGQVINAIAPNLPALDRRLGRPGPLDQHAGQRLSRRQPGRL